MIATTRGAILRGTRVDEFGETVDDNGGTVDSWVEVRKNWARNPEGVGTGVFSLVSFSAAARVDFPGDVATCTRFTRTGSGAGRITTTLDTDFPGGGLPLVFRIRMRASADIPGVTVVARPNQAGATNQRVMAAGVTIPAGVSEVTVADQSFAAATGSAPGVGFAFIGDVAQVGQTLDLTAWQIEQTDSVDDYFSGNTPDEADRRFGFTGVMDRSTSIQENLIRTVIDGAVVGLDDFPVSITEHGRAVFDPAESTYRTVRELVARIPPQVAALLLDGDRLRDNRTGDVYIIDESEPVRRSVSGRASASLSLRRTDG